MELKSTAVPQVKVIEQLFADVGKVDPQAKMKLLLLALVPELGANGVVILLQDKKTKIAEKVNPVSHKCFFIDPPLRFPISN